MDYNMLQKRIQDLEEEVSRLPQGKVAYKTINGKKQPYLQWTENGKQQTKYIKKDTREDTLAGVAKRIELENELTKLRAELAAMPKPPLIPAFKTNVLVGRSLDAGISRVSGLKRRYCYKWVEKYLQTNMYGRVCVLYGLRRTGKTTLLFQALQDLSEEERSHAVYMKARTTDSMSDVCDDLNELVKQGYRYAFIDEVTLLPDFIDSASVFSDIYAMQGMKIILSGTDSLGFWFTQTHELYDRAYTIHTTFIPFREYSELLGIDDVDEYIRYGGTLLPGELAFDDPDATAFDAAFRDDETTRRYIDTAICENIQHSLACCERGNYFRHLRELYDAGELTGAINRIIESMNNQFLLSVLKGEFKSHDLGSAAELLRKQPDEEKRTRILDRIDREAITKKLMEILHIRSQQDIQMGITETHIKEIKEYLKALDLIVDCPRETMDAEPEEYVLFTQPGMRYSQAQALVHVLMKDELFRSFDERERELACEKILEDVKGRMMEDIVLLETDRALPKNKRAFKLTLPRSEVDMLIYTSKAWTGEAYEIKHSSEIVPRQYHVLEDAEQCALIEKQYGPITKKSVIYRGDSCVLENGIIYQNVEEYLKAL